MQITSKFSPNFSTKIWSKPQNLDSREEDAEDSRSPNGHCNRRRAENGDWWVPWLRQRCLLLHGCHRWVCCSILLFTLYGIVRFILCGISNQLFHFQSFETNLTLDIPCYKVCECKKNMVVLLFDISGLRWRLLDGSLINDTVINIKLDFGLGSRDWIIISDRVRAKSHIVLLDHWPSNSDTSGSH